MADSAFSFDDSGNLADTAAADDSPIAVVTADSLDQLTAQIADTQQPDTPPVILSVSNQVGWEMQKVQPPSGLYLNLEDRLQVSIWSVFGIGEIDVSGRLLMPDGSIRMLFFQILNPPSNLPFVVPIQLAEGFLLDLVLTCVSTGIQRGMCFCQVAIVRGSTAAPRVAHVLVQDYVWTKSIAQWPGSPVRDPREGPGAILSNIVTNPANGADWSFSIQASTRARVDKVRAVLTTNATVASRVGRLVFNNASAVTLLTIEPPSAQVASLARGYNWAQGLNMQVPIFNEYGIGLPVPIYLEALQTIASNTPSLQALDNWTGIIVTLETWIAPT